jgi:hypothetical protein
MDFGLARSFVAQSRRLTATGTPLGTPAYMSPEQVNGDPKLIGPATDVYALGMIFYELLTGQVPFEGPLVAVFAQILNTTPEPPSRLRPDLDARVDNLCLKALAKKAEDRYPTVSAFAAALVQYTREAAVPAVVASTLPTIPEVAQNHANRETVPPHASGTVVRPAQKEKPEGFSWESRTSTLRRRFVVAILLLVAGVLWHCLAVAILAPDFKKRGGGTSYPSGLDGILYFLPLESVGLFLILSRKALLPLGMAIIALEVLVATNIVNFMARFPDSLGERTLIVVIDIFFGLLEFVGLFLVLSTHAQTRKLLTEFFRGRWHGRREIDGALQEVQYKFGNDGTLEVSDKGLRQGTYKLLPNGRNLVIKLGGVSQRIEFRITENTLELTDTFGETTTLTRVKTTESGERSLPPLLE